jgi:flagellar basal-body rod modification protein FlgD
MADSTIGTKNVYPYYAKTNITNAGTGDKGKLGKDEFLKIMIAQMKNQDPMQPLDDKAFVAQMAQFTSVEQLANMSSEMKLMRQSLGFASGLIGKEVAWININDKGESISSTGVVESIVVKDGSQYALVKGEQIALDRISKISNPGATQS